MLTLSCSVCLPTMRLLVVKLFPAFDGSSNRNQKQYRKYGNDEGLKNLNIGRGLRTLTSRALDSSRESKDFANLESDAAGSSSKGGRSYIEGDEISLVDKNSSYTKKERMRNDEDPL
jgi:hypothetical protein